MRLKYIYYFSMYVENQGILSFDMPSDCFPNLEVCSFAFNRLKDVPRFLYGIPKIQNIYLNNNKIKKFRVNRGSMQKGKFKKSTDNNRKLYSS